MKKKYIYPLIFGTLFYICGCATLPRESLNLPSFRISGKEYVPLKNLCELKGIAWTWDNFGNIVSLKKDDLEARLLVNSSSSTINGREVEIKNVPIFYKGMVVVPAGFNEEVIAKLIRAPGKKEPFAVVIDSGHGGKDPGALGRFGIREKDITLDVARRLKNELEEKGIDVIMTRDSDRFISLPRRCEIANKSGADLFVSIHVNANRARSIQGFEVYYAREANDASINKLLNSGDFEYLFRDMAISHTAKYVKPIILDMIYTANRSQSLALAKSISYSTVKELSLKNRGIKNANFYVLKNTHIPAILIEIGYLSNATEERYLKSSFYRGQLAKSICLGLLNYQRKK